MNPSDVTVGSLWLDRKAEVLFIPADNDRSICWYVDKSESRHGKVFIAITDETFWLIQRVERFQRIA